MSNTIYSAARQSDQLICVWVPTGDPRIPLSCFWIPDKLEEDDAIVDSLLEEPDSTPPLFFMCGASTPQPYPPTLKFAELD